MLSKFVLLKLYSEYLTYANFFISLHCYRLFFFRSTAQFFTQIDMELFCQFITWTNWVNSGKFMDNCWLSCQVMADMENLYNDLIILNLYQVYQLIVNHWRNGHGKRGQKQPNPSTKYSYYVKFTFNFLFNIFKSVNFFYHV